MFKQTEPQEFLTIITHQGMLQCFEYGFDFYELCIYQLCKTFKPGNRTHKHEKNKVKKIMKVCPYF